MAYLTQKKALQKGRTRKVFFFKKLLKSALWFVSLYWYSPQVLLGYYYNYCHATCSWMEKNIITNIAVAVVVCYWFMHILINSAWNCVVNCYHTKMFEKNGDAFYGKSYFSSKV